MRSSSVNAARPFIDSLLSCGLLLLLCFAPARAATQDARKERQGAGDAPAVESARWQYLLDELAAEARGLPWEKGQATLTAVVADAYWDLNRSKSERLFKEAFEAALSHKPQGDAGRAAALRQIIALAARRDIGLAKSFSTQLLNSASKEETESPETIAVALDLIESDAGKAAQLAEAVAPAGPSFDAAWFIMQLAKKDPAAAERVYRSYLQGFATSRSAGLEKLLWLAGYPFGYVEAFGFTSNPPGVRGFSGMRSPRLAANPALAAMFIQIAFREAQNSLKEAANAPSPQGDALYGLVLFTATYLQPEVARYRPQASQAWQSLYNQAIAGASPAQREAVAKRVQEVFRGRLNAGDNVTETANSDGDPQAALDRAEKLTNPCERDRAYARVALGFNGKKDYELALKTGDKISADALRRSVREYVYYDVAAAAAADAAEPNAINYARGHAERVEEAEQRATLNLTIAAAALRKGDFQSAGVLLAETKKLAERTQDARVEASILIAAATLFAESDPQEAGRTLREAVKVINRAGDYRVGGFRFMRRVNLACEAGEESWYGGAAPALSPSLFKALGLTAGADIEEALQIARGIDKVTIRIPALTSIVKVVVKNQPPHPTSAGVKGDSR